MSRMVADNALVSGAAALYESATAPGGESLPPGNLTRGALHTRPK